MKANEMLFQAIGEVDAVLVERAAQKPTVKMHTALRLVAVAAAVALVAGLGLWAGLGRQATPQVDNGPGGVTQPTTTTTQSPEENPNGVGGDNWGCPVHSWEFHRVPGELYDYVEALIGEEQLNNYFKDKDAQSKQNFYKDTTYPYDQCYVPGDTGLPGFLEKWGITREQFIEAMGWGEFLDHVYQEGYPYVDDGHYYHFTYQDFVDAIYGDDPHLTAWVFHNTASYASDQVYQDFYYDDWVEIKRHGDPVWDYIRENYKGFTYTYDAISDFSTAYKATGDVEPDNVFHLVQFFGIDRDTFIGLYGWGNKLDEKATEHFPYAPYTYRQFVDAVYGEDDTLRRWVFNPLVFHPEYPTLEEFAALTEEDRFCCAPFIVTKLEPTQCEEVCTEHNPMYHNLSYFSRNLVDKFKRAYASKDKEELNVVNFVKYLREIGMTYSFDDYYEFSLIDDRDKIAVDHGVGCPYTYGQFYYAVFGSDPELTAWVFAPTSTWPVPQQWPPQGEWPPQGCGYEKEVICIQHKAVYHDLSYFPVWMVEAYKASVSSGEEEAYNLFDFIRYHHLNRSDVAEYLGFPDYLSKAMDEAATIFGRDSAYTYNQFLDAIYGDDSALTQQIFGNVPYEKIVSPTTDPNEGRDETGNTTMHATP